MAQIRPRALNKLHRDAVEETVKKKSRQTDKPQKMTQTMLTAPMKKSHGVSVAKQNTRVLRWRCDSNNPVENR
jgi:hypothetical protein